MFQFTGIIEKFGRHGEKSGWTYIFIPADVAAKINPGVKKAYRTKGTIQGIPFQYIALAPMGEGDFILPLSADFRKKLKLPIGEKVIVQIEKELAAPPLDATLLSCLADDPDCLAYFQSLSAAHQRYFSNYVTAAKTAPTQAKRIAQILEAMENRWNYAEMIRAKSSKI